MIKDSRGKTPQFVIIDNASHTGEVIRHQPTGIEVPLSSNSHADIRAAMTDLRSKI